MKLPVAQSAFLSTSLTGSRAGSMRIIPVCPITVPHGCASMTRALLPSHPKTIDGWLVSAAKGDKGDPGLSVIGGGHWESSKTPYEVNTMVTLAGCVFISKVKTSNPPIRIARFKNGNYRKKKDGGYILSGKSADRTVHEDGRCFWTGVTERRKHHLPW